MEKGVYVRLGSSNRRADTQLIGELQRGVAGIAYDSMPMPQLTLDDLDLKTAQTFFGKRRKLDEKTLLTLKLISSEQGRLVPTRGAILLFGKERERHFPDAWVQCGRFIGKDKSDIFDHIELYEPLPQSVDSIILFLKKHAMRGADFSEIRRKDLWSIPLNILREVVINALVHCDYSHQGTPIRIAFYDDRIEIESPGILLPGMTIEDMKEGMSQIRNPVIARIFRELKLIEQWGSGIPGVFREAREQGLTEPQILEIGMRLRFTIYLADFVKLSRDQSRKSSKKPLEKERLESRLESRLAAKVMLKLDLGEAGKAVLAKHLGHKKVSGELNKQIKRLLSLGLITMTIPDKPNSRLQKYRITDKGQLLMGESK